MATVRSIEERIREIEGFDVRMKQNGRDIRGDKQGFHQYQYGRASRRNWTVARWKQEKFNTQYPGLEVDVLDADGNVVDGRTTLATVRDSYDGAE